MGITADIFKPSRGDCSAGGLSSRADQVTIVNADGPFEPSSDAPAVAIIKGNLPGIVKAVPVLVDEEGAQVFSPEDRIGPMYGGTCIGTSDSRFSELVEEILGARFDGAVKLHDRYETQAQYDSLST